MLDRQKVETILARRFCGAQRDQIAAAANALMGLDDEWEEVSEPWDEFPDLAHEEERATTLRLFRRRSA